MDSAKQNLLDLYQSVRSHSCRLTASITEEDSLLQSMPEASPSKWHLAHTTWFFETMVLEQYSDGYVAFDANFKYLFNSYYEAIGPRMSRPQRGLISRPTLTDIYEYRLYVDGKIRELVESDRGGQAPVRDAITLGLNHEQQHQELIATDIVHAFSCNPISPVYDTGLQLRELSSDESHQCWIERPAGLINLGNSHSGFSFDNERPAHPVWLQPFAISNRLVTCGEYLEFMNDGGYRRPEFWLSDGWAAVQQQEWDSPLYWRRKINGHMQEKLTDGSIDVFGVHGLNPLDKSAPVMNISFYEAYAYALWANARLPSEYEWEASHSASNMAQVFDAAWQWTSSSYSPYPGFKTLPGLAAEYNGKFMVGQQVLRGGSFATPQGHSRGTYRNFFPPETRWQFSGIRLARNI